MLARFFCDETDLALGKALEQIHGSEVVYPGHAQLPEVPRGTFDDTGRGSQSTANSVTILEEKWSRIVDLLDVRPFGAWMYAVTAAGLREIDL